MAGWTVEHWKFDLVCHAQESGLSMDSKTETCAPLLCLAKRLTSSEWAPTTVSRPAITFWF
jgi:hypothetical protein